MVRIAHYIIHQSQVHGVTFLDNMEGLGLYHVLRVAASEQMQRATVVELVQARMCVLSVQWGVICSLRTMVL